MRDSVVYLIQTRLKEMGIEFKRVGKTLRLRCLNPAHPDENPSMYIYLDDFHYHCYGCGAHGYVKDLLNLDIPVITRPQYYVDEEITRGILSNFVLPVKLPVNAHPLKESIRGLSMETLRRFDFHVDDEGYIFPVRFTGILVGWSKRLFNVVGNTKWVHSEGNTVYGKHFSNYPYPFHFPGEQVLIIVEGVFDMLRLYEAGYPNTALMWGCTFNNFKAKWLLRSLPKAVIIVFDNDSSGQANAMKYFEFFKEYVPVTIFPIEGDPDEYFKDKKNCAEFKRFYDEFLFKSKF